MGGGESAFAKTFGTANRNREKNADRRGLSNDPRNNSKAHFGFSLLLVSKVPNGYSWNHMALII